jgi:hypothetical protein
MTQMNYGISLHNPGHEPLRRAANSTSSRTHQFALTSKLLKTPQNHTLVSFPPALDHSDHPSLGLHVIHLGKQINNHITIHAKPQGWMSSEQSTEAHRHILGQPWQQLKMPWVLNGNVGRINCAILVPILS